MATCSINTSQILVDQDFSVSWSGNAYGNNSLYLSLGGFDSGGSLSISAKIKDLSFAASGTRTVKITRSEYESAIARLDHSYPTYKVALVYLSYNSSFSNFDSGESPYVPIQSYLPTSVSCSSAQIYRDVQFTVDWSCGHIEMPGFEGTWAVGTVVLCKYISSAFDSSAFIKYYVNNDTSGDPTLVSGTTNVTVTTTEFNTALQSLGATSQDDLRFRIYIRDNLDSIHDYTEVPYAPTPILSPASITPVNTEETDQATLTWVAGTDGENNPITGYEVSYATSSSSTPQGASATWTVVGTFTGLTCTAPIASTVGYYTTYRIKSLGTTSDATEYTYTTSTVKHVVKLTTPSITFKSSVSSRCIYYIGESTILGTSTAYPITYYLYRNGTGLATITTVGEEMEIPSVVVQTWGTTQGTFTIQSEITVDGETIQSAMSSPAYYRYSDITACGVPTDVELASAVSYGASVRLSWTAGSDGVDNEVIGYEVSRRLYSNEQWGSWEVVNTTDNTYMDVSPPSVVGNSYQFRVRTMGSAGASYYSNYTVSSNNLTREDNPASVLFYYLTNQFTDDYVWYYNGTTWVQCDVSIYVNGVFIKCGL